MSKRYCMLLRTFRLDIDSVPFAGFVNVMLDDVIGATELWLGWTSTGDETHHRREAGKDNAGCVLGVC